MGGGDGGGGGGGFVVFDIIGVRSPRIQVKEQILSAGSWPRRATALLLYDTIIPFFSL